MSSDIRELLRSAAEVEPSRLDARAAMTRGMWLRWRRRVQVALPAAVAGAVLLAVLLPRVGSFVDAERISPARPGQHATAPPDEQVARTQPRDRAPSRSETGTPKDGPASIASPNTETADSSSGCRPLITDPMMDVSDTSIDIVRSSIAYNAEANALTFTHVMRDIKPDESAGEGPFYDLRFAWDGVEYSAEAYLTASGGQEFSVVRASDRPPVGTSTALNQVQHGNATGRIDAVDDTVVLRLLLDNFNESEAAAASSEDRPSPNELKVGATLRRIGLTAYPRGSSWSTQEHETDVGAADCDYVIAPED